MKNPLKKLAMGMGNLGDDETERMLRMVQTRADNKALLGRLFINADEASREKARTAAEKLFRQTPAVVTMRPNMQTKQAAEEPKKSSDSKPKSTTKKTEPPHPLKTVEKVHKHTLDAVKHVTHPGLAVKPEKKPEAKSSTPNEKQAAVLSGNFERFVELDSREIAKNVVECFEKKAHLPVSHRLYPELLKVASESAKEEPKKGHSKLKHYAKYIGVGSGLGAGLGAVAAHLHGKKALHGAALGAAGGSLLGAGWATDPQMTGAVVRHVAPHIINHSMKAYRQNKQHEHESEMHERSEKERNKPRGRCQHCGAPAPNSGTKCSYCGHSEFSKAAASAASVGAGRPLINLAKRPGPTAAVGATPVQSSLSGGSA